MAAPKVRSLRSPASWPSDIKSRLPCSSDITLRAIMLGPNSTLSFQFTCSTCRATTGSLAGVVASAGCVS